MHGNRPVCVRPHETCRRLQWPRRRCTRPPPRSVALTYLLSAQSSVRTEIVYTRVSTTQANCPTNLRHPVPLCTTLFLPNFPATLTPTLLERLTPILWCLIVRAAALAMNRINVPLFLTRIVVLRSPSMPPWSLRTMLVPVSHFVCINMSLGTIVVFPTRNTTVLPALIFPGETHLKAVPKCRLPNVLTTRLTLTFLRSSFILPLLTPFMNSTLSTLVIAVTAALLPKAPSRTIEPFIPIGTLRTTFVTADPITAPDQFRELVPRVMFLCITSRPLLVDNNLLPVARHRRWSPLHLLTETIFPVTSEELCLNIACIPLTPHPVNCMCDLVSPSRVTLGTIPTPVTGLFMCISRFVLPQSLATTFDTRGPTRILL